MTPLSLRKSKRKAEICSLPKAQVSDDIERLLRQLDCCVLLFIHMGTSGTMRGDVNHIKTDFTSLDVRVKGMRDHIASP